MNKAKILMLLLVIILIGSLFVGCVPTIPTNSSNLESEDKFGLKVEADVDPKNGLTPLTVQCVGFVSGGTIPYAYQWEFGDGNWSEKGSGIEHRNLFYIYTEPGEYEPILHVEDNTGKKNSCKAGTVKVYTKKPFNNDDEFPLGSNFRWEAIDTYSGPGPNYFSSSIENVWLDEQDRLHLKIVYNENNNRWECALLRSLKEGWGYGKYTFEIADVIMETINKKGEISYWNRLDENVVIGLYTYDKSATAHKSHNELDIEFASWGKKTNTKYGNFVVWYDATEGNETRNLYPFSLQLIGNSSVHSFEWNKESIQFDSTEINKLPSYPDDFDNLGPEKEGYDYIPEPNNEQVCMNIWLLKRKDGSSGEPFNISGNRKMRSAEVIISSFYFNHAPTIDSTSITLATKDEPYSYDVEANDLDGDSLTYSLTTKPDGMNINPSTGLINWTPSATGDFNVTVRVSDGELFDTQGYTITVSLVAPETYTITATAGLHGSINPSGDITVNQGSDQSFVITPDIGYQIDDVLLDGNSIGTVSSHTFTNVSIDHTISATFSLSTGNGPVHNLTKNTYYNNIQAAINEADSGDIVEVSTGTYYENINFLGKNIMLRSTDPNDPSVVTSTIIDGGGNGSVVTFANGEAAQAVLSGFTIQNGNAKYGGGIFVDYPSSPTITGNTITGNTASGLPGSGEGGGVYLDIYCSSTITGNTITGNTASNQGGGIFVYHSSPTITGNIISNNEAGNNGGGIHLFYQCSSTITGNTITGNRAADYGGGIHLFNESNAIISENTFTDNSAGQGGGAIDIHGSSPTIINNVIVSNTAGDYAGGIYLSYTGINSPIIIDNTITNNSAGRFGGGIYDAGANTNTTLAPVNARPNGWGSSGDADYQQNIPYGTPLVPEEGEEYFIAGNTFLGNEHGTPLDYTEGAHVYFVKD